MGWQIEPAEAPREPSAKEMADQFAAFAIEVVMKENAEMPVLSSGWLGLSRTNAPISGERAHNPPMECAQAELELAIHHLKQVEERISSQREKIARLRAGGLSPEIEKERLASLLRSLEGLTARLGNEIDPGKPDQFSNDNWLATT
jgi:hypothetical protein